MDDVVLARHGESETAAFKIVGGDSGLTGVGQEQARVLGRKLAPLPFDVCVTSGALRARETAALALVGRFVPTEVDERLGDIDFGVFAGGSLDAYREWISSHPPDEAPPGGESRVDTLRRFATAFRALAARIEPHVLVVAHGLTLTALTDETPQPVVAGAGYGSHVRYTRAELLERVVRIERWCEAPAW